MSKKSKPDHRSKLANQYPPYPIGEWIELRFPQPKWMQETDSRLYTPKEAGIVAKWCMRKFWGLLRFRVSFDKFILACNCSESRLGLLCTIAHHDRWSKKLLYTTGIAVRHPDEVDDLKLAQSLAFKEAMHNVYDVPSEDWAYWRTELRKAYNRMVARQTGSDQDFIDEPDDIPF